MQGLTTCVKTKKLLLTKNTRHADIYGQRSASMRLGWTGVMWFFWMSQTSICLAHMGGNNARGVDSIFWTDMCNLILNSEEEDGAYYGLGMHELGGS
jgi:hypothetical protein